MTDSEVVIRVEGLGKSYALHHETSERYPALRDVLARQARATAQSPAPGGRTQRGGVLGAEGWTFESGQVLSARAHGWKSWA